MRQVLQSGDTKQIKLGCVGGSGRDCVDDDPQVAATGRAENIAVNGDVANSAGMHCLSAGPVQGYVCLLPMRCKLVGFGKEAVDEVPERCVVGIAPHCGSQVRDQIRSEFVFSDGGMSDTCVLLGENPPDKIVLKPGQQ